MLETKYCSEFKYLSNIGDIVSVKDFIANLRNAIPTVSFSCESYHNETRTRTESYTDSSGKSQTRTVTETVRVVTHRDSMVYQFAFHDDISEDTLKVKSKQSNKLIKMSKHLKTLGYL